jgi:hypothetical protein
MELLLFIFAAKRQCGLSQCDDTKIGSRHRRFALKRFLYYWELQPSSASFVDGGPRARPTIPGAIKNAEIAIRSAISARKERIPTVPRNLKFEKKTQKHES